MALVMLCRNMCTSRKFLNVNFNKRLMCMINTNLKSVKKAPISKSNCTVLFVPKRTFFGPFKRPTKEKLKIIDNIPDEYSLIYRNTMDRYILAAQLFSTVTAFTVILVSIINHDFSKLELNLPKSGFSAQSTQNEIYIYLTAFIGLVVLLQIMVARIPLRIYYLPQQKHYIFTFYGNYPFTQRKLTCNIGEVFPLPEKGISPWATARYSIRGEQNIILMDQYFRRPADLHIMLGVQKDHDVHEEK